MAGERYFHSKNCLVESGGRYMYLEGPRNCVQKMLSGVGKYIYCSACLMDTY